MSQPSYRALRAFVETARCGSLAAASRALNVTPSAISHLLSQLEQSLGIDLVVTRGPNLRLTEPGARFARQLTVAFDAIGAAVQDVRHQVSDVRISALSSFLTLWLVPRLASFQSRHPGTRLLLSTGIRAVDLAAEPFECAIRWGHGAWPNLEATLLFRDQPVVVTNPRIAATPERAAVLPRLAARTRPDDWRLVGTALGWPDRPPILTLETRALAIQAAVAGIGTAVVDRNLVAGLLTDGLLIEIAPKPPVCVREGHWIVALPDRLRLRAVREFRDWLVNQASA